MRTRADVTNLFCAGYIHRATQSLPAYARPARRVKPRNREALRCQRTDTALTTHRQCFQKICGTLLKRRYSAATLRRQLTQRDDAQQQYERGDKQARESAQQQRRRYRIGDHAGETVRGHRNTAANTRGANQNERDGRQRVAHTPGFDAAPLQLGAQYAVHQRTREYTRRNGDQGRHR